MVGYAIGALLYNSVGAWLIQLYGYGDKVEAFRAAYAQWGAWIILLKGLTPIPYKIVTITSGFAGYNLGLIRAFFAHYARHALFRAGLSAAPLRRTGPPHHREAARAGGRSLFAAVVVGRHGRRAILGLSESALLTASCCPVLSRR